MVELIQGDIFEYESECMVNAWNRNFIPWFLLLSHGISGQLKKKAGYKPFNELLNKGILKSGDAVITDGGRLNKRIIHVAGLTWYWTTNLNIVETCTRNALILAKKEGIKSISFPLIGTGVGGLKKNDVIGIMSAVAKERDWNLNIYLVEYQEKK